MINLLDNIHKRTQLQMCKFWVWFRHLQERVSRLARYIKIVSKSHLVFMFHE